MLNKQTKIIIDKQKSLETKTRFESEYIHKVTITKF